MINFQQLFLVILLSTLTILIVIFSIYVFRILNEMHLMLKKVNKMLDDMGTVTSSIAKPIAGLSDLASGLKRGLRIFEVIARVSGKKAEEGGEEKKETDGDKLEG